MNANHSRLPRTVEAALLAASMLTAASVRANDGEAKMYAITDFTSECGGNDVPDWDNMIEAWYNELAGGSAYFADGKWVNGNLTVNQFCDKQINGGSCDDVNRIDDADAVMIGFHGSDSGHHWAGTMRRMAGTECAVDAPDDVPGGQFFLGADADVVHFSSCNSMDDDNLKYMWRMFQDNSGGKLKLATGFHGVMWISSSYEGEYEDFADDAHDASIRDIWLDEMYDWNIGADDVDMCPVAYSIGTSLNDCLSRLSSIRYGNEGSAASSLNSWCFTGLLGCNPRGDDPFSKP